MHKSIASSRPSKTAETTETDNQKTRKPPKRSPESCAKLIALGVPKALVDTFPLTPHSTGRWCKKLPTPHGPKVFFFGPLGNWQAALDRLKAEKEDLIAGRTPTVRNKDAFTLGDLCNRFLLHKLDLVKTGELSVRSWDDYEQTCRRLLTVLGKQRAADDLKPEDFELLCRNFGETWAAVRIGNQITRVKSIFKYGVERGDIKPPTYGSFRKPTKKTMRIVRKGHGQRMYTREELLQILDAAPQPMRSMVLCGINGGLGNHDVGTLTLDSVDLERGWLCHPRPKTGTDRRVPLWPETVASIKAYLAKRATAKRPEDEHLLFLTTQRLAWTRQGSIADDNKGAGKVSGISNPVAASFRRLCAKLGINGRRGFYALRHTFRTIGRGARDREAIDALMGHTDASMAGHYIEDGLPDERLQAVTDYVRRWLFGK